MSRALPSRVSLVGLAGFLVVVALVPGVAPNAYVVQVLAFTGLNVMLAVGLNLLMGYAGLRQDAGMPTSTSKRGPAP